LVTYSSAFDNAYWTKAQSSVLSGQSSPDGLTNAFKLVEDTSNSTHLIFSNNINTGAGKSTLSIKAKAGERNWIEILDTENNEGYFFDLTNGVVGTTIGTPDAYSIKALSDGWYDISVTVTSTTRVDFQVYIGEADNDNTYLGDGTSGVYIYGAQLEFLGYATTLIPTSGATATRLGDVITGAGSTSSINSPEGVLFMEIAAFTNDVATREISISDGTTANRVNIRFIASSNNIRYTVNVGAVTILSRDHTLTDVTLFNDIALKWKVNDFAIYVNGVEVYSNLSGISYGAGVLNVLDLSNGVGGSSFYGKIKQLRVYPSIAAATIDLPYIS